MRQRYKSHHGFGCFMLCASVFLIGLLARLVVVSLLRMEW